jgi:hypothetical protein
LRQAALLLLLLPAAMLTPTPAVAPATSPVLLLLPAILPLTVLTIHPVGVLPVTMVPGTIRNLSSVTMLLLLPLVVLLSDIHSIHNILCCCCCCGCCGCWPPSVSLIVFVYLLHPVKPALTAALLLLLLLLGNLVISFICNNFCLCCCCCCCCLSRLLLLLSQVPFFRQFLLDSCKCFHSTNQRIIFVGCTQHRQQQLT